MKTTDLIRFLWLKILEMSMESTDKDKLSFFRKFHKDSFEALTIQIFHSGSVTDQVIHSIILQGC